MRSAWDKQSSWTYLRAAAVAVVLAVGIAAYSNSFSGPFVLDDLSEIVNNDHVRIQSLGGRSLWDAAWRSPSHRRPVANISFALNYYIGGTDVRGYHAVNLLIHLTCAVLVYFLAVKTFDLLADQRVIPDVAAFVTSLLFVAHPVQTQAVTYIVQRMTSLTAAFYIAAILLYIHGRMGLGRTRALCWCCGIFCGLLALGTKEIAATLPLAVILYEWYFFRGLETRWTRRTLAWLSPLVIAAAVACMAVPELRHELIGGYADRDFTLAQRLLTECRVVVYYLSLVLWPVPSRLSITHWIVPSHSLLQPITTLLSLLVLILLATMAVVTANRFRIVSFGIVWFFLHLAIESTVVPLELAFEHRLYLPMVGLSLIAAWTLCVVLRKVRWILAAAATLGLLLAAATYERNGVWQDDYVLWSDALVKYPQDHRAWNNLGIALDAKGQPSAAMEAYRRSLELRPEYPEALINLGGSLTAAGNPAEAADLFRKTISLKPGYPEAYYNLGIALSQLGSYSEAIESLRMALELRPGFVEARNGLGDALDSAGELDAAIEQYRLALEIEPRNAEVLNNLGVALAKDGNTAAAIEAFEQSLGIEPDNGDTHYNLGTALTTEGRQDDANVHFRAALDLAVANGDTALADVIRQRMSQ